MNKEIDFHHLKSFYDNILKYLREYIKSLRRDMFAINVVNKFNRRFIYIY